MSSSYQWLMLENTYLKMTIYHINRNLFPNVWILFCIPVFPIEKWYIIEYICYNINLLPWYHCPHSSKSMLAPHPSDWYISTPHTTPQTLGQTAAHFTMQQHKCIQFATMCQSHKLREKACKGLLHIDLFINMVVLGLYEFCVFL